MTLRWIRVLPITGLLLLPPSPAAAATISVTTAADEFADPGPGTGCSLREAVRAANSDAAYGGCPAGNGADTIILGAAGYTLTRPGTMENATATGDLDVLQDLTITGQGSAATTIDGGGLDRVLHVDVAFGGAGPDLAVSDLTVRGGDGTSFGGGILVEYEGGLTLDRVVVTDNEVSDTGGGLHAADDATVTVTNSSIIGNRSTNQGGGIGNWQDSVMSLTDTTVSGNFSEADGGGIINENSASLTITRSTISQNTTSMDRGGGIFINNDGILNLTNSTISGNLAAAGGGGLFVNGDDPLSVTLTNVTVAANTADVDGSNDGNGGGIGIEPALQGSVTLTNTLVADNVDGSPGGGTVHPDCSAPMSGPITSQGHNLIESSTGCTIAGTTTGNITGADPMLGPLADNGGPTMTRALQPGSPAVDAADPAAAPLTDQRGVPRNPDIGAYELVECRGVVVNRVGTPGDDVLTGTDGPDGFLAQGGNDRANGLGGNDAVCLGDGNDGASGGGGKDQLLGEKGNDRLRGQGGKDLLLCGPGKKDVGQGGPGKDKARRCEKGKP